MFSSFPLFNMWCTKNLINIKKSKTKLAWLVNKMFQMAWHWQLEQNKVGYPSPVSVSCAPLVVRGT